MTTRASSMALIYNQKFAFPMHFFSSSWMDANCTLKHVSPISGCTRLTLLLCATAKGSLRGTRIYVHTIERQKINTFGYAMRRTTHDTLGIKLAYGQQTTNVQLYSAVYLVEVSVKKCEQAVSGKVLRIKSSLNASLHGI